MRKKKMKKIWLLIFVSMLFSCSSIKNYYSGFSPNTCYGLGNPQCVKDGYRKDLYMHREMTVDELEARERAKRE